MTIRSWCTLTGSAAALAALMLYAAPASAQFYEEGLGEEEGIGEEEGFGNYLGDYHNELGEDAGYSEDYTNYYEGEEEDD
jgi:hypothetical protein